MDEIFVLLPILFRSDCSYSSRMLCTKFMDLKLLSAITCCSTWSCSVVFPKCLSFLIILEVFIQNYSSMLFVALPLTHQSLLLSSFLLFSFLITLITYIYSLQIARRSPNWLIWWGAGREFAYSPLLSFCRASDYVPCPMRTSDFVPLPLVESSLAHPFFIPLKIWGAITLSFLYM